MGRRFFLTFFISLFVFALFIFFLKVRPSFSPDPNPIIVQIPKAATAFQITKILWDKKIISSPTFFLFLSKIAGKDGSFKHGTYQMERNHYWAIVRKLYLGLTYKIKVTIPEGWTSYQIAQKLENSGIIADPEFFVQWVQKNKKEGMLFPETYFIEPMTDSGTIIETMVQQLNKNYKEEFVRRASELKMTQLQVLTLASIIEREARIDSERSLISSVYHNRLKRRWFLEADPTVQYALSSGKSWKERLTYKDLNVASPYNTYRKLGLPPGPICNPGKKSIEAALYPADSQYLYFVADGKGAHFFFTKYNEHILKKRQLQKQRKANASH